MIRRWFRWLMTACALLVLSVVAFGALNEALWRVQVAQRFPARGRLVDIGGRSLQLDCRGRGSPVVVFESGLDHLGSVSWSAVHDAVARTTRACAYSRAGIMWSDAAPGTFTADRVVSDLHHMLRAAGEQAPLVLVGHSLGGPYVMRYAARYPNEVSGVVLVDASHPAQQQRLATATGLPLTSMQPPTLLLRVGAALARTGVLRVVPAADAPRSWPALARDLPTAYFSQSIAALLDEAVGVASTFAVAGTSPDLGNRPLVVLTAGMPASDSALSPLGMSRAQEARKRQEWTVMQEEMARWSRLGRQVTVPDATHYIQFDRPDVVIRAIQDLVTEVRAATPARARKAERCTLPPRASGS